MAAALREAGVRYDELDHGDVSRLFPEMRPQPDAPAIFQPDGAVILARRSILLQVRLAVAAGAVVHEGEKCVALAPQGDGVRAFTRRRRIDADVAVVCAGPWSLPLLVPLGLRLPLQAGLAQVTSFRSLYPGWEQRPGLMERTSGPGVYGMPEFERGYKLGWATINPMTFWKASKVRPYDRENEQALVERVRQDFPGFDPTPLRHEAGPITLVPDELFVIDRRGPIVVGAACIGHAFKFSPVLGELFADLAEERPLPPEARRFGLDRPTLAPERRSGRVAVGA
jgi:sarcosine oxidase